MEAEEWSERVGARDLSRCGRQRERHSDGDREEDLRLVTTLAVDTLEEEPRGKHELTR